MLILLTISDKDYEQLQQGGPRIKGSIGLTDAKTANFTSYTRWVRDPKTKYKRTAHGKVSFTPGKGYRVVFSIDPEEHKIDAEVTLNLEVSEMGEFVYDMNKTYLKDKDQ